jgi:AcrR family transcriptional regulator
MDRKPPKNQPLARRQPQQERARQKLELILEAAVRILDKEGMDALTTNRVAEVAGISIGTLYQYFSDKRAIVDALARREMQSVTEKVMRSLTGPPPDVPGGRIRHVIQAVLGAFGGRPRVHRLLLERALAQGAAHSPFGGQAQGMVASLLTSSGIVAHDGRTRTLTAAEAYVVTRAFGGVVRDLLASDVDGLDRAAVEDALVRLIGGFLASSTQ